MSRRRLWVLVGVHVLFLVHLAHWRLTGRTLSPVEPSEAMELGKHGVVNAGLVFFAAAILSTALLGRFFCGWGCHLVALQDLCGALLKRFGIRPKPLRSRLLLWVPLIAFVYMFLWPAAYRMWIGDRFGPLETALTTESFWATFPGWGVALLTFGVCGFATVYFLGAKGFCTYACPYGAAFGLVDKLSPGRIRVTDACEGCGHCTAVCTSNVRVHEEVRDYGMVVDPGCMKCMDCVSVCPNDALFFGFGKPALLASSKGPAGRAPRRLPWREELLLGALFALAFLAFRGLYGAVPFLLSLGLAAVLAYLGLQTARLLYRPNLRLRRWQLRLGGRLQKAGAVFLVMMAALTALWAHSGWIQLHSRLGLAAFERTAPFRNQVLEPQVTTVSLGEAERQTVEGAIRHLRRAVDHALVRSPDLGARLAWLELLAGDSVAFEERARQVLSWRASHPTVHLMLGKHYAGQGRAQEAAYAYQQAIAADPRLTNAYLGFGTLLASAGRLQMAGEVFEEGLVHVESSRELYFNAGLVRALREDTAGAVNFFEQALSLDPTFLPARENLAGVLASSGLYREAVDHYLEAIQQAPGDVTTRLLTARAYLELGELDAAQAQIEAAERLAPGSSLASELRVDLR